MAHNWTHMIMRGTLLSNKTEQAEELLPTQDADGGGVLKTAEGAEWENVLLTNNEEEEDAQSKVQFRHN